MEKGGAERVISALANYFSGENSVTVLTLTKSKDAYRLNSTVKRLYIDETSYKSDCVIKRKMRKLSIKRFTKLHRTIITENPDIIISFLPEPSIRLMFVKKFSKKMKDIPTIISIRTDPAMEYRNHIIRFMVKKLYQNVDGMVYQTEDAKNYFDGIIKTKNQIVIQNPIDTNILIDPKTDEQKEKIIVSVGRLEKAKNQELLIRAFNNTLNDEKHDYILKIYGEGSYRCYLQDLINGLKLNNRVFLMGQVEEVPKVLNEAKIFAFCSLYEGMPNSLIEAMAMGLPCIATDCPCGGPRSLIKDGENGILVDNNNEKDFTEAIKKLIHNKELRKKISKNALKIRKSNNINVIASEWLELIRNLKEGNVE